MAKRFTWERGPFGMCPACQRDTFGILSAGGDRVALRCTECRYSDSEALPEVDKRVIYLDQSIFSLLFQVEGGGRPPPSHEELARELYGRLRRVVLLHKWFSHIPTYITTKPSFFTLRTTFARLTSGSAATRVSRTRATSSACKCGSMRRLTLSNASPR